MNPLCCISQASEQKYSLREHNVSHLTTTIFCACSYRECSKDVWLPYTAAATPGTVGCRGAVSAAEYSCSRSNDAEN